MIILCVIKTLNRKSSSQILHSQPDPVRTRRAVFFPAMYIQRKNKSIKLNDEDTHVYILLYTRAPLLNPAQAHIALISWIEADTGKSKLKGWHDEAFAIRHRRLPGCVNSHAIHIGCQTIWFGNFRCCKAGSCGRARHVNP
jgi:hypothetical protein